MEHATIEEALQERIRLAPGVLIAGRIKRARKEFGTHDQLAAELGTNRSHLIKLEKALHRPRAETLLKIAAATGRPVDWFLDPEVEPSPFPADANGNQ